MAYVIKLIPYAKRSKTKTGRVIELKNKTKICKVQIREYAQFIDLLNTNIL